MWCNTTNFRVFENLEKSWYFCFQGSVHLYEAGTPESLKLLKDIHCGTFVGICCLVGNDYCVVGIVLECIKHSLFETIGNKTASKLQPARLSITVHIVAFVFLLLDQCFFTPVQAGTQSILFAYESLPLKDTFGSYLNVIQMSFLMASSQIFTFQSCRDNGEIQVWTIAKGLLISSYTIGLPVGQPMGF